MEPAAQIQQIENGISGRLRLMAVQDLIALSGLVSAAVAVLAFLLFRLGLLDTRIAAGIGMRGRLLLCLIPATAAAALVAASRVLRKRGRWRSNLEARPDQSDLILDRALHLEDRTSTAGTIIRRGGPVSVMETALVEDAASRLAGAGPERIVAYRAPRLGSAVRCCTSVSSSIVTATIVLVAIVQYLVPTYGAQELDAGTIAVMQEVGEGLEQSSKAIQDSVNQDTPTAALAKEQAELAHALKESSGPAGRGRGRPIGKSQALKELSVLADKLGDRRSKLENTRASEIISLADRRFQSTLSGTTKLRQVTAGDRHGAGKTQRPAKNQLANKAQSPDRETPDDERVATGKPAPQHEPPGKDERSSSGNPVAGEAARSDEKGSTEPKPGAGSIESKREDQSSESRAAHEAGPDQSSRESQRAVESNDNQPQGSATEQKEETSSALADAATAAVPNLSEDLLQKAAEMRAGKLTAADIEQLRKAAQGLLKDLSAKDLANLANSKAIQQTLEQLARQVDPQQIEQLARQLLSQKEIRDELQAVRKLLTENRQAKEAIAGFADKAREIGEQLQKQGYKPGVPPDSFSMPPDQSAHGGSGAGNERGSGSGDGATHYGRAGHSIEALKGQGASGAGRGRPARAGNQINWNPEGEPIYGRARPGTAPARVPYSSAYPGYRREAERSVQRSQVPPNMRALIRNYFDAINPDAGKRP